MPKQKLTGGSSLLTPNGWLKPISENNVGGVIGVDRSGKLTEMPIEISAIGKVDTVAFIGSEKAFGQFHPESRLIDSDGASRRASKIVEESRIGNAVPPKMASFFASYLVSD